MTTTSMSRPATVGSAPPAPDAASRTLASPSSASASLTSSTAITPRTPAAAAAPLEDVDIVRDELIKLVFAGADGLGNRSGSKPAAGRQGSKKNNRVKIQVATDLQDELDDGTMKMEEDDVAAKDLDYGNREDLEPVPILKDKGGDQGEEESDSSKYDDELLKSYLEELCSYGVERLHREPQLVSGEAERLQRLLQDVACSNYRALIESFEAAGAVRDGFVKVRSSLHETLDMIPHLSEHVRSFSSLAWYQNDQRKAKMNALNEHPRILELLELPSLMLTLVMTEHYEEALELESHIHKVSLLVPKEPLIQAVQVEVQKVVERMVHQLLASLKAPLQLPGCLRIVGFLRRLGVMSEMRLRRTFLYCRGEWIRNSISSITASSAQGRLVRLADDTRAMLFEVITQYNAVFGDENVEDEQDHTRGTERTYSGRGDSRSASGVGRAGSGTQSTSIQQASAAVQNTRAARKSYSGIVSDWTQRMVNDYLYNLERNLHEVSDGASLATVLQQSMYCGQSLGRVGADFRARLVPIFSTAIKTLFKRGLEASGDKFKSMLDEYRWTSLSSYQNEPDFRGGHAKSAKPGHPAQQSPAESADDPLSPPSELLDYLPLAVFLNGILWALNELRICCPVALAKTLSSELERTLSEAIGALAHAGEKAIHEMEQHQKTSGGGSGLVSRKSGLSGDHGERQHFVAMLEAVKTYLVPYVGRCFNHCLGIRQVFDDSALLAKLDLAIAQAAGTR